MLKRPYNIFILTLTLLFLWCQHSSFAAETFYFYDDLGRLNRVITEAGDAATYSYDEVGNLLSISRQTTNPLPPIITGISPDIVFAGTTVSITITGNNLMGTTDVYSSAAGININSAAVTNTAITATLNVSRDAAPGTVNIQVTTVFGTASISLIVMKLTIAPTIKTMLAGGTVDFRLELSPNAPRGINISLISEDISVMQVPASMTFSLGQNTLTFTATALTEGTTVIKANNGAAAASVYVTQPFTGSATAASLPVSVFIEQSTAVNATAATMPVSVYIEQPSAVNAIAVSSPVSAYIEQPSIVSAITASLPVSVYVEQSTSVNGITVAAPVSAYIEQSSTVDAIAVSPLVSAEISSQ